VRKADVTHDQQLTTNIKEVMWIQYFKLVKENLVHLIVVVLTSINNYMVEKLGKNRKLLQA
jgi:hypothetical protein